MMMKMKVEKLVLIYILIWIIDINDDGILLGSIMNFCDTLYVRTSSSITTNQKAHTKYNNLIQQTLRVHKRYYHYSMSKLQTSSLIQPILFLSTTYPTLLSNNIMSNIQDLPSYQQAQLQQHLVNQQVKDSLK